MTLEREYLFANETAEIETQSTLLIASGSVSKLSNVDIICTDVDPCERENSKFIQEDSIFDFGNTRLCTRLMCPLEVRKLRNHGEQKLCWKNFERGMLKLTLTQLNLFPHTTQS